MTPGVITLPDGTLEMAWWGDRSSAAPALVLLHEGLGCVELWRDVPARLHDLTGCPVFAYSRFGYGRSDPVPLPRPLDYMQREAAETLPRVLRAADIKRLVLIGHSDGGSIAAAYAGRAPAEPRLLGLVTIAAHFFVEDLNIRSIEQIGRDYDTTDLRARLGRYHTHVDVAFQGWHGAWLDPGFRAFDLTEELRGIRVPVLGLQGADDPYGSEAQLTCMRTHVAAPVETRLIPGAKHAPHLEAKPATLAAIADFVAAINPRV
ncbi:alpha/beta fold hydrolase [Rhodopila sp.]|uniref:alpha/beta fold hydrolase n=1 Tax=Rhodopila sp. TaxID=2480087 RepID=UPI002BF06E2D|nr:alpha/beta hydrolase [Rhodopila sp.]HVZ07233.1 alpha/beta hydrolase [Rhodopila sp.]